MPRGKPKSEFPELYAELTAAPKKRKKKKQPKRFSTDAFTSATKVIKPLELCLTVPDEGLSVCLRDQSRRVIATILLRPTGFKVIKANAKSPKKTSVAWATTKRLRSSKQGYLPRSDPSKPEVESPHKRFH